MSARRGKPAPEPDDRGAPAGPSSIEKHPRWPEVRLFLEDALEPARNSFLVGRLRDLARIEDEQREAGAGPNLAGAVRGLGFLASEAGALVERYTRARVGIPAEVLAQRDAAEDRLSKAETDLAERLDVLAAISRRLKEAHKRAVTALHAAIRARLGKLADESTKIVRQAPAAAQRHPERLPDRLDEIGRAVSLAVDLAQAFSAKVSGGIAGAEDFWSALPEGVSELVGAKLRTGRPVGAMRPAAHPEVATLSADL